MDALLNEEAAAGPLARFGREAVKEELRRAMAAGATRPNALWDRRERLSNGASPPR